MAGLRTYGQVGSRRSPTGRRFPSARARARWPGVADSASDGGRSRLPLRGSPGFAPGSLLPRPAHRGTNHQRPHNKWAFTNVNHNILSFMKIPKPEMRRDPTKPRITPGASGFSRWPFRSPLPSGRGSGRGGLCVQTCIERTTHPLPPPFGRRPLPQGRGGAASPLVFLPAEPECTYYTEPRIIALDMPRVSWYHARLIAAGCGSQPRPTPSVRACHGRVA